MWIENKNSYRMKQVICAILGVCASLILTCAVLSRQEVMAEKRLARAQENLSEAVLRFHILANSDSKKDQELKISVRDGILSYMKETMAESDTKSAEDTKEWVCTHLTDIEHAAENVIAQEGYEYSVRAAVSNCYFPDRRYGDVLFPKGYYEALRVEIGEAAGHNWWCVLYPSLCFTEATCAVVTEEGRQELAGVLCEEDYEAVTATSGSFKIKSFFYELFKERTEDYMEEGQ